MCAGGGEERVATASNIKDPDDANEDMDVDGEDSSEDRDGGSAIQYSAGGRKNCWCTSLDIQ
jgi:hypothetical protein